MKRGTNPVAVIVMLACVAAAIFLAFFIKSILPESISKWKDLIFWGTLVGGSGIGGVISGRFLNRKR